MGGWLYNTQNSITLTMSTTTFNSLKAYGGNGGLISTSCSSTTQNYAITDSTFTTIATTAGSGGVFYMCGGTTNSLTINSNSIVDDTFNGISALTSGGAIWQQGTTSTIQMTKVEATTVSTSTSGGFAYQKATVASFVTLTSFKLTTCSSYTGRMLYMSASSTQTITLTTATLTSITAEKDGGVIYKDATGGAVTMAISDSTVSQFTSSDNGAFIFFNEESTASAAVTITGSTFECTTTSMWDREAFITVNLTQSPPLTSHGGMFYFEKAVTGSISSTGSNTYRDCYTTSSGGAFHMGAGMTFTENSGTFTRLASSYGAAIYCDGCTASFTSTSFTDLQSYTGGVMYLDNGVTV